MRVTIGVWYGRAGMTKTFLNYLTREGVGRDGGRGRLFDASGREPDSRAFIEAARRDPRQYLLLLSPQAGRALDLQAFTGEVMRRLASRVERPLVWISAAHYNTQHPHTHTVLRGRDRLGEPVIIDRRALREDLRVDAERLATGLLVTVLGTLGRAREAQGWGWQGRQGREVMPDIYSPCRARSKSWCRRPRPAHPGHRSAQRPQPNRRNGGSRVGSCGT